MSLNAAIANLERDDCDATRRACYRELVAATVSVSPGITSGQDLKSAMMVYADCPADRFEPNVTLELMSGLALVQSAFDRKCERVLNVTEAGTVLSAVSGKLF